jgi:hypothetical protein
MDETQVAETPDPAADASGVTGQKTPMGLKDKAKKKGKEAVKKEAIELLGKLPPR